jgi:hypothetical protein
MGWAENVKKIESRSQESESRIKLRKFLSIEPQNKEPQNLEVIIKPAIKYRKFVIPAEAEIPRNTGCPIKSGMT